MLLETIQQYPKYSIIAIAIFATFFVTLVNYLVSDRKRINELRDIQKSCRIKLRDNKDNPKKLIEIQKQMMDCSLEMMRHSFKPMIITFVPLIFLLAFIKSSFENVLSGWVWWYIGTSIIASIFFRKVFKL